jgi:hypothetical protein
MSIWRKNGTIQQPTVLHRPLREICYSAVLSIAAITSLSTGLFLKYSTSPGTSFSYCNTGEQGQPDIIGKEWLCLKGGVRMASVSKRAILLSGVVSEDRQLQVELPDEVQPGHVDLIIMLPESPMAGFSEDKLSQLRARLEVNGHLSHFRLPDPTVEPAPLTDSQLLEVGTLPAGARPSHELIDEDRGDRI